MGWNLIPNGRIRHHYRSHILEDCAEAFIVAEDPGEAAAVLIETFKQLDPEERPYVTTLELVGPEDNMNVIPLIVQKQKCGWFSKEEVERIKKTWDTAITTKTPGYRDFVITRDTNLGDLPRDAFGTPYPNCTVTKGDLPPECRPNSGEEYGDAVFNETRKLVTPW